jgi:hypothetical protein
MVTQKKTDNPAYAKIQNGRPVSRVGLKYTISGMFENVAKNPMNVIKFRASPGGSRESAKSYRRGDVDT